jgi:hypothetical protein
MGLVTIFYCLRFVTSLFIASYDSQGYGGGIRPCLHTGVTLFCLYHDTFLKYNHYQFQIEWCFSSDGIILPLLSLVSAGFCSTVSHLVPVVEDSSRRKHLVRSSSIHSLLHDFFLHSDCNSKKSCETKQEGLQ